MPTKSPKTPFSTRLSGNARETELRLRSIFQWQKKRPSVWLLTLSVLMIFTIGWAFGIRTQDECGKFDTSNTWTSFVVERVLGKPWILKTFDTDELSMLLHYGSSEERKIAKTVLAQAEQAFSELGLAKEEAEEKHGLLSRYVMYGLEDIHEQHSLKLLSAEITDDKGTMWVHYSQKAVDSQGNTNRASSNVLSLWSIQKDSNGQWRVSEITEPA